MIIPEELAQRIVGTAMCAVHCNVNIMNRDGIIIATGHPHRYRTFHKGAKDAVDTNKIIEIYPHELHLYPGALQGVNYPIVLDEQIVGVVGIFGYPDQVREMGLLVKMITEMILERELLQQETHSKYRLSEQFVELALWDSGKGTPAKLKRIAKSLEIDLLLPRTVAIFDSTELILKTFSEYGETELVLERVMEIILKKISNNDLINNQDIAAILDKRLFMLKAFPPGACEKEAAEWAERLAFLLSTIEDTPVYCGLGAIVNTVPEYLASYKQAEYCLKNCTPTRQTCSIYDKDLLVRHIFFEAKEGHSSLAIRSIAACFNNLISSNDEYRHTIAALLANNLDLKLTADALHVHRNTLIYRLNRFRQETGLDPLRRIDDAIMCKMLLEM